MAKAVANAVHFGVKLGALCAVVAESLNATLKLHLETGQQRSHGPGKRWGCRGPRPYYGRRRFFGRYGIGGF